MDPIAMTAFLNRSSRSLAAALLGVGLLAGSGCTTRTERYDGRTRDQVWTAMVTASESPTYPDWHVIENDVWADEGSGRIEVYRLLRRYRDPAGQWARLEDREWTFSIRLEDPDAPELPPEVSFKVRSWCVPSHSWMESDRYFEQVWQILGGRPAAVESVPPSTPAPEPAQNGERDGQPVGEPLVEPPQE